MLAVVWMEDDKSHTENLCSGIRSCPCASKDNVSRCCIIDEGSGEVRKLALTVQRPFSLASEDMLLVQKVKIILF